MSENLFNDQELLRELEPTISDLTSRHERAAKSWEPHRLVPWSEGRDFTPGDDWTPDDYPLPSEVRSAIYVNLLTEDNLPYYTNLLLERSMDSEALRAWVGQWTAEEARHSDAIRAWAHATRAIDPSELEQGRMVQMRTGIVPRPATLAETLVYTSFQELATNVAHRNTGRKLGREHAASKVMATVAGDEMNHHNFYRDLAAAGFEIDPSQFTIAAWRQINKFEMPGTGIPGFKDHAQAIAISGIYGVSEFRDDVLQKTLDAWNFWNIEGLNDAALSARELIEKRVRRLGRIANIETRKREEHAQLATGE